MTVARTPRIVLVESEQFCISIGVFLTVLLSSHSEPLRELS